MRLILAGHHPGVFVLSLKEDDLFNRHKPYRPAHPCRDPAQAWRARLSKTLLQRVQHGRYILGRLKADTLDGLTQSVLLDRLEKIVDGAILEGLNRELVKGSDKDDVGSAHRRSCHVN